MRIVIWLISLVAVAFASVHLYFFWTVGTFDPCHAAVLRIVQKQRAAGQELQASVHILLARQLEDAMRSQGVLTCYRSALRGEAPEPEQFINER